MWITLRITICYIVLKVILLIIKWTLNDSHDYRMILTILMVVMIIEWFWNDFLVILKIHGWFSSGFSISHDSWMILKPFLMILKWFLVILEWLSSDSSVSSNIWWFSNDSAVIFVIDSSVILKQFLNGSPVILNTK